jgi:periplasmic protein CpxP/Spy
MLGKKTLFAAGLVALIAAPVSALAFGGGPGGHEGGGPPPMMMLLKTANLTTDQQTQVHQILQAGKGQIRPLFQQLHTIDEQIASKLLGSGTVTASDFTALEQQKSQIQQQIDQNMINTSLQIRNLLSPTQLTAVSQTNQKLESLHQQIESLMNQSGGDNPAPAPQD